MDMTVYYAGKRRDGAGYNASNYEDFEVIVDRHHDGQVSMLFVFPEGSPQVSGHVLISESLADWLAYALLRHAKEGHEAGALKVVVTKNIPKWPKRSKRNRRMGLRG